MHYYTFNRLCNNEVFQELVREGNYLVSSDEKLKFGFETKQKLHQQTYLKNKSQDDNVLTLTVKLKAAVNKTLSLSVTGYSQEEYLHSLFDKGVFMMYKHYTISKQKDITA